jgi:hypothetical protein
MPGPKPTCIFQSISNKILLASRQILDRTKKSVVIQVANVPLQLFPHQAEARKQKFSVMNSGLDKKSVDFAPVGVREEVRE